MPNKKNNGQPKPIQDERTKFVPVGCGKCEECLKQKARSWNVRLQEEIRHNDKGQFVTLTFSNESYAELSTKTEGDGYIHENNLATLAVRRFLERWRKKHKISVRHWLVTELGHEGTENIHLHGIIFTDQLDDIREIWAYGFVFIGQYVNEQTINYIVKYISEPDQDHENFTPKVLCSKGIGAEYMTRKDAQLNQYNGQQTKERYVTRQGIKLNLPIYYRNKIYTDEEREKLWCQLMDKDIRYVRGVKINIADNEDRYYRILKQAQSDNTRLGYGSDKKDWDKILYERQRRNLRRLQRIANSKNSSNFEETT